MKQKESSIFSLRLLCFALAAVISFFGLSQDNIVLDIYVIDTTTFNGDTIIVFNDKSWEYLEDYNKDYKVSVTFSDGIPIFDSTAIKSYNWNNNKTFSNKYNLANMTDTILLNTEGFHSPVSGRLTSGFKIRWGRWHKGHDYSCVTGTPIRTAYSGVVRYAKYNSGGYGNLIIIRHYNGLETYYAHLSKINVEVDQVVSAGDTIAKSGNSGNSEAPHLHFECRFLDNAIDPDAIIDNDTVELCSNTFSHKHPSKERFRIKEKIFGTRTEVITRRKRNKRVRSGNL